MFDSGNYVWAVENIVGNCGDSHSSNTIFTEVILSVYNWQEDFPRIFSNHFISPTKKLKRELHFLIILTITAMGLIMSTSILIYQRIFQGTKFKFLHSISILDK